MNWASPIIDSLLDTLLDGIKMLPILYLAYLLMEFLEHRAGEKMDNAVAKVGKAGPLLGAALGIIPQCGFSGAVAGFYAGGVATLGTMIAVFLSTSDEMLPLLLSHGIQVSIILKLLGGKFFCGLVFGYLIDLLFRGHTENHIEDICEQDNCDCEHHNIFLSALIHTAKIWGMILLISFILNLVFAFGGEDVLQSIIPHSAFLSAAVSSLIGLIPSCSASVFLTELYLNGLLTASSMFAGLCANAGVGLVVLFRQHRHFKENLGIVLLLYITAILSGMMISLIL